VGTVSRRRPAILLLALTGALVLAALGHAPAVPAQTSSVTTTSTIPVDVGPQGVIPLPNSGHKPQSSGDLGGSEQLLLFGILTVASAFIFGRVLWAAHQRTKANEVRATRLR
jgi:hypothetical protein